MKSFRIDLYVFSISLLLFCLPVSSASLTGGKAQDDDDFRRDASSFADDGDSVSAGEEMMTSPDDNIEVTTAEEPIDDSFSYHRDEGIPVNDKEEILNAEEEIRWTLQGMQKHATLAGNLLKSTWQKKLRLNRGEASVLSKSILATAHWEDLVVILMVGWFLIPLIHLSYENLPFIQPTKTFAQTHIHLIANQFQQVARIALLVYAFDVVKMFCVGVGIDFCSFNNLQHAFAQSAYTVWIATRVKKLKKYYIRKYVSNHPETFGRMQIVNRFADTAIYFLAVCMLLSILKFKMGLAMKSVMTLGGASTLALGLGSQAIAEQVVTGWLLASSERIYEGDKVRLGNGKEGTIVKLGWLETVLRDSDAIMVSIPNSDLLKDQVSNLSRVRHSRVKQTLKFKYTESNKLPALLKSIKEEIKLACPDVITDGSRPLRAVWTNYLPDGLEVTVDAHFRIKPVGDVYWDNRQRVLQAINRAVMINGVQWALPGPPVVIKTATTSPSQI